MDNKYLEATRMLNYNSVKLQNLIQTRRWNTLDEYDKIKAIYNYVQNEILFGYNREDTLTAEQVLLDGYGQCNTKATLLMALLRGVGIPCRVHGSEVSKEFQRGATSAFIAALAPSLIVHTWAEVLYNGQWLALEGVITDKKYVESIKKKFSYVSGEFKKYAIATNNFEQLSIDWVGKSTYVQNAAVIHDFGVFPNPDTFFSEHTQSWGKVKQFMYANIGRWLMNYNVNKERNRLN